MRQPRGIGWENRAAKDCVELLAVQGRNSTQNLRPGGGDVGGGSFWLLHHKRVAAPSPPRLAWLVDQTEKAIAVPSISARLARLNWKALETDLWNQGHAVTEPVLTPADCEELVALYPKEEFFRKTIHMAPRRFGEGDYKYFKYPLPPVVHSLRVHLYRRLAPIANRWMEALGGRERYPLTLREFVDRCHRQGQKRPAPLLLHYEAGGYNCLHQDLYGPLAFPLQVTAFLSRPSQDYGSGAFLLYELRPRAQSMCDALVPEQGALVIFATRMRPERGQRGYRRVQLKHGVARVRSGKRYTLGVIFHDAK